MKPYFAILAGLVFAAPLARAQVIINQAALDQLAGIPPVVITAPPEIRAPAHRVIYRPVVHRHVVQPPTAHVAAVEVVPKSAVVPKAAVPQVQPVVAKPVIAPPPSAAAIDFASGAADLPAGVAARLKPFCAMAASDGVITIDAYAAADASDPSAAPRLSMARAFALRDALEACGVASARIIPRANGVGKNPDVAQVAVAP